jgi:hypothetical protein
MILNKGVKALIIDAEAWNKLDEELRSTKRSLEESQKLLNEAVQLLNEFRENPRSMPLFSKVREFLDGIVRGRR